MVTKDGVKIVNDATYVYALNIRNGEVAPQHFINVTNDQMRNCKYFSTRESRTIWLLKRNNFIDYVLSFYGENGIYSTFFTPALTKDDVMFISNAIDKVGEVDGEIASVHIEYGDTFSREFIRDYMFLCRKEVGIEHSFIQKWFDKNVENNVVEHEFLIKK